jgi:hypothetical protein
MIFIRCEVCEAEVPAQRATKRYCDPCGVIVRRQRQRRYEKRVYDAARIGKPRLGDAIKCESCSAEITRSAPLKRYCTSCIRKINSDRVKVASRAARGVALDGSKVCGFCSRQFVDRTTGRRKYCGECSKNAASILASRRRRRRDPGFAAMFNMKCAIRKKLQLGRGGKRWHEVLGYTARDLKAHLERQFGPGMSWENYGPSWHIDHIVPLSSFRPSSVDDPEFKAAFALTNLRPLSAEANMQKHKRRTLLC